MQRVAQAELLDDDLGTPEEISGSLDDLWRFNRLGGVTLSVKLLCRVLERKRVRTATVLDVGAGDGRLALHLRAALATRGIDTHFVELDRRKTHLRHAPRDARLRAVAADALRLPFPDRSFDAAMCNLLFHHFSDEAARKLLQSMARVAREAVIVNDLERHWLPYLFIRAALWFTSNRITRFDAGASVRQAYTRSELAVIMKEAGFRNFEIDRFFPFRLGAILWTT